MKKFNPNHLASARSFPIGCTITNGTKDFIGVVVNIAGFDGNEISYNVEGVASDGHYDTMVLFVSEMERLT